MSCKSAGEDNNSLEFRPQGCPTSGRRRFGMNAQSALDRVGRASRCLLPLSGCQDFKLSRECTFVEERARGRFVRWGNGWRKKPAIPQETSQRETSNDRLDPNSVAAIFHKCGTMRAAALQQHLRAQWPGIKFCLVVQLSFGGGLFHATNSPATTTAGVDNFRLDVRIKAPRHRRKSTLQI